MSRIFEELERDLVRVAAARARPARRPFAAFGLTAALVLGVAGTAAGGTYLALRASSIAPFADSDVPPEQRVAPGTSRVPELRAADPDPGAPPWTVRVSRSGTGLVCSTVGQVRAGAFGLVGLDGQFRAVPEANADACGEPGTLLGVRVFAAKRSRDVRTVVNGVAGEDLERVTLAVAGRPPRTLPHSPEGAFAFVLRGFPEDAAPVVTLQRRGGATRRYAFAGGDRRTVPDPFGGRAWRVSGFAFGWKTGTKPPRTRPGCVSFATARPIPGERAATSPPVCGLEPARRGVKLKPLYFTTRRLSGAGEWNHHPPRVAVWGSARGHGDVVVRAGGFSMTLDEAQAAAFVVFLPQGTDPASVSVTVGGRRHGSTFGTVKPPRRDR